MLWPWAGCSYPKPSLCLTCCARRQRSKTSETPKWNQLSIHAARWILFYFRTSLLPLLLALPLSLSLSAPVQLRHLTIWNCTKYNLYNSEKKNYHYVVEAYNKHTPSHHHCPALCPLSPPLPILVMMQSSSGTVIMLPSVNPWAPILSAIRISSAHSQRHIHSRSRVGVGVAVGAVACNQRLPCRRCGNPAAEKLCIIKYCIRIYIYMLWLCSSCLVFHL